MRNPNNPLGKFIVVLMV